MSATSHCHHLTLPFDRYSSAPDESSETETIGDHSWSRQVAAEEFAHSYQHTGQLAERVTWLPLADAVDSPWLRAGSGGVDSSSSDNPDATDESTQDAQSDDRSEIQFDDDTQSDTVSDFEAVPAPIWNETLANVLTKQTEGLIFVDHDIFSCCSQYIAHQCNCSTRTANGFAATVFSKYPHTNTYSFARGKKCRIPGTIEAFEQAGETDSGVINLLRPM